MGSASGWLAVAKTGRYKVMLRKTVVFHIQRPMMILVFRVEKIVKLALLCSYSQVSTSYYQRAFQRFDGTDGGIQKFHAPFGQQRHAVLFLTVSA